MCTSSGTSDSFIKCTKLTWQDTQRKILGRLGISQGELGFYDFYIIPLAKKLKDCGVFAGVAMFGVASDEYLDYATANRTEWELKGKSIVQEYLMLHKKDDGGSSELGLAGNGLP
jgi:hypothetical protein